MAKQYQWIKDIKDMVSFDVEVALWIKQVYGDEAKGLTLDKLNNHSLNDVCPEWNDVIEQLIEK